VDDGSDVRRWLVDGSQVDYTYDQSETRRGAHVLQANILTSPGRKIQGDREKVIFNISQAIAPVSEMIPRGRYPCFTGDFSFDLKGS
jgi:hypothetical protein